MIFFINNYVWKYTKFLSYQSRIQNISNKALQTPNANWKQTITYFPMNCHGACIIYETWYNILQWFIALNKCSGNGSSHCTSVEIMVHHITYAWGHCIMSMFVHGIYTTIYVVLREYEYGQFAYWYPLHIRHKVLSHSWELYMSVSVWLHKSIIMLGGW